MSRPAWITPSGLSLLTVAVAAALLGTEGLLRRPLLDEMTATAVVLAEHLLLAGIAIPLLVVQRHVLATLSARTWLILLIIGWGASAGAALMFTKALESGNPTTASLLQNTQPLFVVFLALLLLKERLRHHYWPCLAASLIGAYLLSFGTMNPVWVLNRGELHAAGLALGAAALWASGTVLARLVLSDLSYVTLTALRIMLALPLLLALAIHNGAAGNAVDGLSAFPMQLAAAALIPGFIAILLFYRGLRGTKASHAVLAEFMYPAAALIGNWVMLDAMISPLQALGVVLLLTTILLLAWSPTLPARRSAGALDGRARRTRTV